MLQDAKTVLKLFGAKLEPFPTLILVLGSSFVKKAKHFSPYLYRAVVFGVLFGSFHKMSQMIVLDKLVKAKTCKLL